MATIFSPNRLEGEIWADKELEGFQASQKLAYDCAERVACLIRPGDTEIDAARMYREALEDRGVKDFFHAPVAWFDERTAFEGINNSFQLLPTRKKLREGMPVILDAAPVLEGYASDIGYAFSMGEHPEQATLKADLLELRDLLLKWVRMGHTMRQIYLDVDLFLDERGLQNCHQKYPFGVLGHKVSKIGPRLGANLSVLGFDVRTLGFFAEQQMRAWTQQQRFPTPFWNQEERADVRPGPGLWALEPHVGRDGVGAKWEEMMVITETDARWLDDDLPHVQGR